MPTPFAPYGLAADYPLLVSTNQNEVSGLPTISGLTSVQVDELFGDVSNFIWTSGNANKTVSNTRYYSNEFNFEVLQLNHAPTAENVEGQGTEDGVPIEITLVGNDPDANDAVESFRLITLPATTAGVLFIGSTSVVAGVEYVATNNALKLYFVPALNFNGTVQFKYVASDGELNSAEATATVAVGQVNDPANFGGNISGSGSEDGGPITGTLTATDLVDGMTAPDFTISSGHEPSHGIAAINSLSGEWRYTPDPGFSGFDLFTVSVTDDDGNVEAKTIEIIVAPVNHAPVATPDFGSLIVVDFEINAYAPGVLSNDYDPDGDPIEVVAVNGSSSNADGSFFTLPSGAQMQFFSDGAYNYQATAPLFYHLAVDKNYIDTITYTIRDSGGLFTDGTLVITVSGVLPGPVPANDAATTDEDTILTQLAAAGVLANDVDFDGSGALVVAAVNGNEAAIGHQIVLSSGALLTLNSDGSYVYNPNGQFESLQAGDSATDGFDYTVANSNGIWETATVTITIDGRDEEPDPNDIHRPVAVTDFGQVAVDYEINAYAPGVLFNDYDPDGDPIEVVAVNGSSSNADGSFFTLPSGAQMQFFSDGAYNYQATAPSFYDLDPGESYTDVISYTIRDSTGLSSDGELIITVTAPNGSNLVDFAILTSPLSLTLASGQSGLVYGGVFEAGLTEAPGATASMVAQLGYGPQGSDPTLGVAWNWTDAAFNTQILNNDEYVAAIPDDLLPGEYSYAYRFGISNNGEEPTAWTYADSDGSSNGLDITLLGTVNVLDG
jgi:VCBS repeat-containing protein